MLVRPKLLALVLDMLVSLRTLFCLKMSNLTLRCSVPAATAPRSLTDSEQQRLNAAKDRLRLLGCIGFGLSRFMREAKSFALSKATFGWIARAPTLAACKQLWTATWKAAARIRYSNPWTRALLWTNCHLDVQWAVWLAGALLKRASKEPVAWTLERGTASAAIHSWLLNRGWVLTEGWKWSHELAAVTLSLSTPRGAGAIEDRIGIAQHSIRQAWRAWVAHSDRHELWAMFLWREGGNGLRNVDWKATRKWAQSSAPAATVAAGASFSPATWARVSTNSRAISDRCVWNCGELGTCEHVMWHCKSRPSELRKPSNALTARFGWSIKGARVPNLDLVRAWMCQAQLVMWKHNHPGRPPDLDV